MINTSRAHDLRTPEQLLTLLADPTRRRIVELLATGPRAASEIHHAFPIADPAVSRHLRVLREAGLLAEERPAEDRRVRLYRLEARTLEPLATWLAELNQTWQAQLESFKRYTDLRRRK
jgi:DNA-binding transcriptional ArsR family regulator